MDRVDFQTWICPICCDDHRSPDKNEIACKHSDLVEMRKQIRKLECDVDNLLQERGKLHEQVKDYEQVLEFVDKYEHHSDGFAATSIELNAVRIKAREVLKKWSGSWVNYLFIFGD